MSYMALYRKFRPSTFEDVKGQQHIVTALKNQIQSDRIGHAYLFCGTRGTGKTTIAKIFAKAVNCLNPVDGGPCNECSVCKGINDQTLLNVVEIDAASNNGVENIRRIIEEVQYSPTEGKYKVYIIDEVHMMSTGAFNALLKTLEEPPSYVMFILATTEAHKLPITILSRCQRYDFKRIQIDTIVERLTELTEIEHIDATKDALGYIAKNADGALRDALSLLDQCNAFYMGEQLTYEKVLDVLGAVDNDIFIQMFSYLIGYEATNAVKLIDELVMEGKDISQFIINFTWFLRNVMLIKTTSIDAALVDMTKDMVDKIRVMSVDISTDAVLRYIRILSETSNQIKFATQKRVIAEMTFIKLCRPQMEDDNQALLLRVEEIEHKLEKGMFKMATSGDEDRTMDDDEPIKLSEDEAKEILKAMPEEIAKLVTSWPDIIARIEQPIKAILLNAKAYKGQDNVVLLKTDDNMLYKMLIKEEHINTLKNLIFSVINKDVDVKVIDTKEEMDRASIKGKADFMTIASRVKMRIDMED